MKHGVSERNGDRGLKVLVGCLLALFVGVQAWGWSDEARMAAVNVMNGNATEADLRLAFENNLDINRMAVRGTEHGGLSKFTYKANQNAFTAKNNELIRDAARKCGLEVDIKPPKINPKTGLPSPLEGTDTDVNVRTKDGKPLTYDQWEKLNDNYKQNVNEYLQKPDGSKPVDTSTDLMPDPKTTRPDDFRKITEKINEQGGTAYSDPAAVRVEDALATKKPVPLKDTGGYVKELQTQANSHFDKAAKTTAQANAKARAFGESQPEVQNLRAKAQIEKSQGANAEAAKTTAKANSRAKILSELNNEVQNLRAKAQIENSQGAKYVDKIQEVGSKIREDAGLPPLDGESAPSAKLAEALRKNRGADTIVESEQIGSVAKNAINNATKATIEELARVAEANPKAAPACRQSIADSMRDMTMSQKGQAMESLKAKYGNEFAKGVATAAQGPTPGARVMKGFGKVMTVVGPGLILWDGVHRINDAMNAPDEAKTFVAGKAAGGFLGGLGGAAAVGMGVVAVLGAPVTAVGAAAVIGAGVAAGMAGYHVGDYAGSSLAGWMLEGVRPRDQSEYDAMAAKGLLDGSKDIYGQLIAAGVPADVAQTAADAYKRGDVKKFREILSAVRNILVKNAKKIPFRTFSDLPETEVQSMLNCLCSKSLGANPWVAQGYSTNIPPNADPDSCDGIPLSKGPCRADGFGCWRSFIKWGNKGIADCLASFGLNPKDQNTIWQVDKFNRDVEKRLVLTMEPSVSEICRGDMFKVTFHATGGRPPYYYRIIKMVSDANPRKLQQKTSDEQMSIIHSEYLTDWNIGNVWKENNTVEVRAPAFSAAGLYTDIIGATYTPEAQQSGVKNKAECMTYSRTRVRVKSDRECEGERKKNEEKKAKEPKKKTPPGNGSRTSGPSGGVTPPTGKGTAGTSTSTTATTGPKTSQPPSVSPSKPVPPKDKPRKKNSTPPAEFPVVSETQSSSPDDPADCWVNGSGSGTPETGNTFTGKVREGRKVRLTVSGPAGMAISEGTTTTSVSFPHVGGDYTIKIEDLDQPGCMDEKTVTVPDVPGGTSGTNAPGESSNDCDSCLTIGGGSQVLGSMSSGADGQSTESQQETQSYWVEGCPGQKVRVSVVGSDGWTGSAEGDNKRALVTRQVGMVSGTDQVTVENLSIPGCSRTMERHFGPPSGTNAPGVSSNDCDSCLTIGGGSQGSGSMFTGADGQSTESQQETQSYWVEGCPSQKVRVSVVGSDGWTGSAEGVNKRALVTRQVGMVSGTDQVTVENLSIPGCSRTMEWPFGPSEEPPNLKDAELQQSGNAPVNPASSSVLGGLIQTKISKVEKRTGDAIVNIGNNSDLQQASNSGNETIQGAKNTRNQGGTEAGAISSRAQQKIRIEEGANANPILAGVISGVGSGLSTAGSSFGQGLGSHVAGQIFDPRTPSKPTGGTGGDAPAAAGGSVKPSPTASSPRGGGGASTGGGGGGGSSGGGSPSVEKPKPPATPPAGLGDEIMADAICLVCGEMYNPALGHVCPGAPSSPETVAPPPAGPMCELCGKPGTPVSTVDGGTKILCDACQGSHRCSQCGQVAMELKSEGFGYELVQPDGTIRSEHQTIKGVCDECLAAWKRKYNQ